MPTTDGHEEGAQAPFPAAWPGDPHAGHHRSCAVRVKSGCTCGYADWLLTQITKDKALMPLASDFLRSILHLPPDVHIVGAKWEPVGDEGNVIFALQAFNTDEFPGKRVTAKFHEHWDVRSGKREVIFDGWEAVD